MFTEGKHGFIRKIPIAGMTPLREACLYGCLDHMVGWKTKGIWLMSPSETYNHISILSSLVSEKHIGNIVSIFKSLVGPELPFLLLS